MFVYFLTAFLNSITVGRILTILSTVIMALEITPNSHFITYIKIAYYMQEQIAAAWIF
jgi:hypothetical protein